MYYSMKARCAGLQPWSDRARNRPCRRGKGGALRMDVARHLMCRDSDRDRLQWFSPDGSVGRCHGDGRYRGWCAVFEPSAPSCSLRGGWIEGGSPHVVPLLPSANPCTARACVKDAAQWRISGITSLPAASSGDGKDAMGKTHTWGVLSLRQSVAGSHETPEVVDLVTMTSSLTLDVFVEMNIGVGVVWNCFRLVVVR